MAPPSNNVSISASSELRSCGTCRLVHRSQPCLMPSAAAAIDLRACRTEPTFSRVLCRRSSLLTHNAHRSTSLGLNNGTTMLSRRTCRHFHAPRPDRCLFRRTYTLVTRPPLDDLRRVATSRSPLPHQNFPRTIRPHQNPYVRRHDRSCARPPSMGTHFSSPDCQLWKMIELPQGRAGAPFHKRFLRG